MKVQPGILRAAILMLSAVILVGSAHLAARAIEKRTESAVEARLSEAGMSWITARADGLRLYLAGTAPDEVARFRALNLVASVIDASRIHESLDVAPTTDLYAPHFSLEMLRNDDGVQLIGLVPETPAEGGMRVSDLIEAIAAAVPGSEPTDLTQTADFPAPAAWDASLRFAAHALGLLKRAKISATAGRLEVTAIAESEEEKQELEAALRRARPEEVTLAMAISAPRPVITPFTLRFTIDADGARFDACSVDTARARRAILSAAVAAGMTDGAEPCTIGLGVPSPRWAEGVVAGIRAVAAMGAGSITLSDADVTLTAGEGVSQESFDHALGELRAALPDAFSLEAVPPAPDASAQGPAEFRASLSSAGRVELRGRLVDEAQQAAVTAFAQAAFGAGSVYVATRLDGELPDGWPVRVLAALQSLSELDEGSVLVRADQVAVTGITGNQQARARITQILSSRLGQGQPFQVDVRYDEALDPVASLPTPDECMARVTAALAVEKITFEPGSAEIAPAARGVVGKIADILLECPPLDLEIAGYTDSQGSAAGNRALSQARAEAVRLALIGRRVDASRMRAVGHGSDDPIADNATEEGREANRRIEFSLLGEEEGTGGAPASAPGGNGAGLAGAARSGTEAASVDASAPARSGADPAEPAPAAEEASAGEIAPEDTAAAEEAVSAGAEAVETTGDPAGAEVAAGDQPADGGDGSGEAGAEVAAPSPPDPSMPLLSPRPRPARDG